MAPNLLPATFPSIRHFYLTVLFKIVLIPLFVLFATGIQYRLSISVQPQLNGPTAIYQLVVAGQRIVNAIYPPQGGCSRRWRLWEDVTSAVSPTIKKMLCYKRLSATL